MTAFDKERLFHRVNYITGLLNGGSEKVMISKQKSIMIFVLCIGFITHSYGIFDNLVEGFKISKSALLFHPSILFNKIKFGKSFTFNQIVGDDLGKNAKYKNGIGIELDRCGNIKKLNDGKKTPLILGSIPRKDKHIDRLREAFKLSVKDAIGIFTFNRQFERDWAGLTDIVEENQEVKLFEYPTTDYSAPSFIDLLRAVRDIENRDEYNQKLAYVHCKAGRGRSATAVAAYILCLCNKAEVKASIEQIECYLRLHRPQVSLSGDHKHGLCKFKRELEKAGSFDALYKLHKDKIEKRDREFSK